MGNTAMLASERIVVSAPMSYHGSWSRTWRMLDYRGRTASMASWAKYAAVCGLILAGLAIVSVWWLAVTGWYLVFGLWLVPYRLIRRGSRKRKVESLRHRETLNMFASHQASTDLPPTGPAPAAAGQAQLDPGQASKQLPPA
jgi:hypothetical protein